MDKIELIARYLCTVDADGGNPDAGASLGCPEWHRYIADAEVLIIRLREAGFEVIP